MSHANPRARVLVVDDDPDLRAVLSSHLQRRGHTVVTCASAAEVLRELSASATDVVVADVRMPDVDGLALCRAIHARAPDLPVILITAFGSMETAVLALRAGAFDFLPKPFRLDALSAAVERAAPSSRGSGPIAAAAAEALVGDSAVMVGLRARIARLGPSDAPVLVTGESGTGKELVARALHAAGPRAAGPLVAVSCAAMPAPLLESELFGHERGAFTDAHVARRGLFAAATGGTLFLDEIGELPLEVQPKLLRALQERAVRPVGATAEVAFDTRVIAATNRDLAAMVTAGTFREDLYYRIHVLHVAVPALRDRGDDVLVLARHLAARGGNSLTPHAEAALAAHAWPGNVRELEGVLASARALADGREIGVGDLPEAFQARASRAAILRDDTLVTLAELERRHVEVVLARVEGNKAAAARILGIERKTLYRMLERWLQN